MNNQFFLNKGGTTGDYTVDVDDSSISDLPFILYGSFLWYKRKILMRLAIGILNCY